MSFATSTARRGVEPVSGRQSTISMSDSAESHADADREPAGSCWGRSVFAVAVVASLRRARRRERQRCTRAWHEVEDGVLWERAAEGVTAVEVARGSAASAAGHPPRRRAAGRQRLAGSRRPPTSSNIQHRGHEGRVSRTRCCGSGRSRRSRSRSRRRRAAARCISCSPRSDSSR